MQIKSLSDINATTPEGRMLIVALIKLSTESQSDKSPDEIIGQCNKLQSEVDLVLREIEKKN